MISETKTPTKQKKPLIAKPAPAEQKHPLAAKMENQQAIISQKWNMVNNLISDLFEADKRLNGLQTALTNRQSIYILDKTKTGKIAANEREANAKLQTFYRHDYEEIAKQKQVVGELKMNLNIAENELKQAREFYKHLENLLQLEVAGK